MSTDTDSTTSMSTDETYGASTNYYSETREFPDLPGDVKLYADGGSSLTLGQEGYVKLEASPMAKILLLNLMQLCRIVCREFEIVTDFGKLRFTNGTSGRCGLVIEGGAEYAAETEPSGGTPTCRFFMGDIEDSSDMRMGMMVNATDDSEAAGLFIGKDGKMRIVCTSDYQLSIGDDADLLYQGDRLMEIDGDDVTEISGKKQLTLAQSETTTIGGSKKLDVAGDFDLQVGGILNIGAAGITLTSMSTSTQPVELKCSSFNITTS